MPDQPALTREERLALKLRDNLRRRKAQAKALGPGVAQGLETAPATGAGDGDSGAPDDSPETLSKAPTSR